MQSESCKKQNPNSAKAERKERLAQELRANLLKRKALARARRPQQKGEGAGG